MRFAYAARLQRTGVDEIVVSFRDLPECLTSGTDEAEALFEAADALEEAIAGRMNRTDVILAPSPRRARRDRGEGGPVGGAAREWHQPRSPGRPPRHR